MVKNYTVIQASLFIITDYHIDKFQFKFLQKTRKLFAFLGFQNVCYHLRRRRHG